MGIAKIIDNGGRRLGIDRRQFLFHIHIPERRTGNDSDRRSGVDRRSEPYRHRGDAERRRIFQ